MLESRSAQIETGVVNSTRERETRTTQRLKRKTKLGGEQSASITSAAGQLDIVVLEQSAKGERGRETDGVECRKGSSGLLVCI